MRGWCAGLGRGVKRLTPAIVHASSAASEVRDVELTHTGHRRRSGAVGVEAGRPRRAPRISARCISRRCGGAAGPALGETPPSGCPNVGAPTVECLARFLYPLPYQTLSGVFATNSGIAPHAALPHPLPPSKHVHHVWVWNGLWNHSVCPILPRDTSPEASRSRLWSARGGLVTVRRRAPCAPRLAFRDDSWRQRYALGALRTLVYVATAQGGFARRE